MTIKIVWQLLKGGILSMLLLLSFCAIQMYFQVAHQIPGDSSFIEIGFPFQFFYFSIDGNGLHGGNILGFFYDLLIIFPFSLLFNFSIQHLNSRLRKKIAPDSNQVSEDKQPIDQL